MVLTESQQIASAIIPKFSSLPSLLSASLTCYEIIVVQKKYGQVYHRILAALNVTDIFYTIVVFCSTWPIPSDLDYFWGNSGTPTTCKVQGFLLQIFGLATPLYVSSLSLYFYCTIAMGFSENKFKMVERWIHVFCLGFPLVTAVISLGLGIHHPTNSWCGIAQNPHACPADEAGAACRQAELNRASAFRLGFFYGPLWVCMVLATIAMFGIYRTVHKAESLSKRGRLSSSESKSELIAIQSFWYLGVFYAAVIPITVDRIALYATGYVCFPLQAVSITMFPLLGFMTYCVFKRRRYQRINKEYPDLSIFQHLLMTIRFYEEPENASTGANPDESYHA